MIVPNNSKSTRLSEIQARALADWWKGRYEPRMSSEKPGEIWHGVVFKEFDIKDSTLPESPKLAVFSLEEAQALENVRDAINPEAPDWVG